MAFKRLLNLAQRRPGRDPSPADGPADTAAVALEDGPSGPLPVLRPAAIFRQLLFDPVEAAPAWARSRPAPAPDAAVASGQTVDRPAVGESRATGKARVARAASTPEPTPTKRTRRPKATGTSTAGAAPAPSGSPAAARTQSKRVAKPSIDPTEG
jgi:hypothetical protein